MYVSEIALESFRNLTCSVELSPGLSVIIGENNVGKSNLIDALRVVLAAEAGPREQLWLRDEDFAHDAKGAPLADTLSIGVTFRGLAPAERAQMVTCLAPSLGNDAARITMRARRGSGGRPNLDWFGGDRDNPDVEPWARTAVNYTYLPPLRDAQADLRPGRRNRLAMLLAAIASQGTDRDTIEQVVSEANLRLAEVHAIKQAKQQIQTRLSEMTGPGYDQVVDLAFSEPQFDRIVGALRALIGVGQPFEMVESGLGFTNLLYMAALLAGLSEEHEARLHVVLVEEPEAHLHPQLQDLLMRYLNRTSADAIQVIASTHSPNLASSAAIERMTILARSEPTGSVVARSAAAFALTKEEADHLTRFLDVTKASLLFARRVALVEGTAEQLLLPAIADRLGHSLPDAGVSVINVGGVAFGPFAKLFGPGKLPYRCAVISDGDPPETDEDTQARAEEDSALSATAQRLLERQNENLRVFLSKKTLEWDIVMAGNWDTAIASLRKIRPRVAARLEKDYGTATPEARADALLHAVGQHKGRFAQALVRDLADGAAFTAPSYLIEAISWLTEVGVATPTDPAGAPATSARVSDPTADPAPPRAAVPRGADQ